jgi:hypothetical protein
MAQGAVVLERTQVFQRTTATVQHEHQRGDIGTRGIAAPTARLGHLRVQPALQSQATDKFTEQRQSGIRRQKFFRRLDLERKHRLCQSSHRPASFALQIGECLDNVILSKIKGRRAFPAFYDMQSRDLGLKKNGFPASDDERGAIAGFYAVAVFTDGSRTFHALSKEQVEWVRDHSRGYQMAKKNRKESPWDTHFVPMGLKTAIRRLCCVFHTKLDTDSRRNWTVIPRQTGHPFHVNLDSRSVATRGGKVLL